MTTTNLTVVDTRKPDAKAQEIKANYPLGAMVLRTAEKRRAIVVGHTDTQVLVLDGVETLEVNPGPTLVVIATSPEDYAERLTKEANRLVQSYGYNQRAVTNTLDNLLKEGRHKSDLIRVKVTTVGHYLVRPRNEYGTDEEMMTALRASYYIGHGEFGNGYFTQITHDDDPNLGTKTIVSTEFELVDEFPTNENAS